MECGSWEDAAHQPGTPDQPWVVVNKDPVDGRSERVYVGYQGNSSMQVAVAQAKLPDGFFH